MNFFTSLFKLIVLALGTVNPTCAPWFWLEVSSSMSLSESFLMSVTMKIPQSHMALFRFVQLSAGKVPETRAWTVPSRSVVINVFL